jgi:hypothetical protein
VFDVVKSGRTKMYGCALNWVPTCGVDNGVHAEFAQLPEYVPSGSVVGNRMIV